MSRHHGVDLAMRDLIREKPLTRIGKILWEHSKGAHDREAFPALPSVHAEDERRRQQPLFLPLHSSASTFED